MKKSLTDCLILLRPFFIYKMKGMHLNAVDGLLMKTKSVYLKIEEEQKVMILLCSLPKRCTLFSNSLIYSHSTLTLRLSKQVFLARS